MSGFVETLGSTRVHPLEKKEQEKEEEEKRQQKNTNTNTNTDVEPEEGKEAKKQEKHDQMMTLKPNSALDVGSGLHLKEPPNTDQDGKSTSRRKEMVLEKLDTSFVGELGWMQTERREADVEIVRLSIVCPSRPEIALSHPFISSPKACLFTLKEGTKYRLKFSFIVSNKVVSGLKYENTLWKAGMRVDRSTVLLGTFTPQTNPYSYQLEEETLPSGILVRGLYSARAKVIDSDGNCYMDIHYHFDIQKKWPSSS